MERLHAAAFEALLRGSDDLVLIVDREGRILDAGGLARARLGGDAQSPGASLLDWLTESSRRALLAFLDALGTDGAITLDQHAAGEAGAAEVQKVRYAVHAILGAGQRRDFLLIGRDVLKPARDAELVDASANDPLTGLANRAGLANGLARLWADCARDPAHPLAWVLMADVDRFKAYNDTYGHVAGDELLVMIAQVLMASVRGEDLVARYGGDEFLLAGRAGDPSDVERIARRVVEAVRHLEPTPPGAEAGRPVRTTISVGGVLAAPSPQVAERDVIAAADRCLYQAKQAGRDRFVLEWTGAGAERPGLTLLPGDAIQLQEG